MTKFFEVQKRDGPARMGKLLLEKQIDTPALITNNDFISLGSIYDYASLDKAIQAVDMLKGQKKLAIGPYVPAALHNEPAIKPPNMEYEGPKGIVVNPFSEDLPEIADVYVLGKAGTLRNPKDLVKAVIGIRNRTHADTALYAPALATPANLALLVYLGIDLLDTTRVVADGLLGRYHTRDGVRNFCELSELPCRCENCQKMAIERKDKKLLIAHNIQKLEEELLSVREQIRSETIREYIERQVRVTPDQTATLRLLDQEHQYLEKRMRSMAQANCFIVLEHERGSVEPGDLVQVQLFHGLV